jgi:plasmid stabilization system protein ParE
MFKVVVLPIAKQDIAEASNWYNSQEHRLGKRFVAEVRKHISFIKKHPEGAPIRYNNTRTAVLDKFPYTIHYRITDDKRLIVNLAVLHTSRNPNLWQEYR